MMADKPVPGEQAAPGVEPLGIGQDTVPGLGNAKGHKGAVPDFTPPMVTQAQRSQTLGRFTGGYR